MGAAGGASQSTAPSAVLDSLSTSLIVQPSATGNIPKFPPEMSAPSITVGGGGAGAKNQQCISPRSGEGLTEQVEKMAEEDREREMQGEEAATNKAKQDGVQGTVLVERKSNEPPNPKKRMWEENTDPGGQRDLPRDEL